MVSRGRSASPILAEVVEVQDLSPSMRRVTVAADALRELSEGPPARWMKVFFPSPPGQRQAGRAISIRHLDRATGRMDLDFVLHGNSGPASRWAALARPGERLTLAGPRGGYGIDPKAPGYRLRRRPVSSGRRSP